MAEKNIALFIKTISTATALVFVLLAIRVVDLQGVQGAFFQRISENNRQFRASLPAERGVFLDRFGEPLVLNTRRYFRLDDPLALYPQTEPLTRSEALALQVEDPLAVGYALQRHSLRSLSLAHVLGYVTAVTAEDLAGETPFKLTDFVGRLGLERQYDAFLRGRDGHQDFEVDALGEKQAVRAKNPPQPGQSVATTLDPYLSTVAWRAMAGKTGAVVILDVETGEIVSLVSSPSFDSNLLTPATDPTEESSRQAALQQALADERQLFFNRAVSGTYPPGSVFKLVTAVAALESQALDVSTTVEDRGVLEVGGSTYANWYYTQYGQTEGSIAVIRALARSNDIYFYRAAEWTGIDALAQKAREFGFGELAGIEISGERSGIVPDPAWKERVTGERWFLGNTYHFGIGQGDLLVTPLQLARMVAVFGNEGRLCQPSLIRTSDGETRQCTSLGLTESTLRAVQQGMIEACSPGGTGFPFFDWNVARQNQLPEGLNPGEQIRRGQVACKTGTAEFGGTDERGYRRTHALFGMVVGGWSDMLAAEIAERTPVEVPSPQDLTLAEEDRDAEQERELWLERVAQDGFPRTLAILVLVESDDQQPYAEGSRDAAPVARTIVDWLAGESPISQ